MMHGKVAIMQIRIRKFVEKDIPMKVGWVNDPANNTFLHYDIPLEISRTKLWYTNISKQTNRYDCVIEANNIPVGLIGLLSIDKKNSKAEYYILIGNTFYKGKGIAEEASRQIIDYGFYHLGLNRIYLYTETNNIAAQKLFEKIGFIKEGCLQQDIFSHGNFVDRYVYGLVKGKEEAFNGTDYDSISR